MSTKKDIPAWLPKWKNPSQYPDPANTTPEHWAWEFLRRNPDYQADYEIYLEHIQARNIQSTMAFEDKYHLSRLPPPEMDEPFRDTSYRYSWIFGRVPESKFPLIYTKRKGEGGVFTRPEEVEKYIKECNSEQVKVEYDNKVEFELSPSQFCVIFDSAAPHLPQIQFVKGSFRWWNKQPGNQKAFYTRDYLHLLQVLDAKEVGATHATIASVLFNLGNLKADPIRTVSRDFKEAKILRDKNYIRIIESAYSN